MFVNKYAMAVEVEDSLFEIFDIFYFEKNTEIDIKYKKATNIGVKAISIPIHEKIKLKNFLNENNLTSNLNNDNFDISENQNIYLGICDNKVFSYTLIEKTHPTDQKYQAAFGSNVVIIDVSSEDIVGLGDLWNGQKIIEVI